MAPFNVPAPPPPPGDTAPPPDREPLLRLCGMYPSTSGTSLGGNLQLTRVPKGSNEMIGITLIDKLQQFMEEKGDARFVLFEGGKYPNSPPYTLCMTKARPRMQAPPDQDETGEGENGPPPEPTPRPIRRAAPRRG